MRLRTVLNELAAADVRCAREDLLNTNVFLTPEYASTTPGDMRFVRLCTLDDYATGATQLEEGQLLLVFTGATIPPEFKPVGDVVAIAHTSSYKDLRVAFLEMPARAAVLELCRERVFEAFLASYDVVQYARRVSAVLGNPVLIMNSDRRLLATGGNFPQDALDVQEVLTQGYLSESVSSEMEKDGVNEGIRHARHSVLSEHMRYGRRWVNSLVYYHHLEMGRFDVMELDRRITGIDLELIDYAGQLAGVIIERLGAAGKQVGAGSSVLADLIAHNFVNPKTMYAQLSLTDLPLDSHYVMLALSGQKGADKNYLLHLGALVERAFTTCLWCPDGELLCVLVPLTKGVPRRGTFQISGGRATSGGHHFTSTNSTQGQKKSYDSYAACKHEISENQVLLGLLENNDVRAWVSEPFDDLDFSAERFEQCKLLAKSAVTVTPAAHGRLAYFWENRFSALVARSSGDHQLEMLLDKRVVAMADYDGRHGTQYLETAVMSVRYPGAPAEAASALKVHRNTYFYRMNKVRELFGLDLKDGDDRLALSFSAQILAGMGRALK